MGQFSGAFWYLRRRRCLWRFRDPARPDLSTSTKWNPKILGLNKRDLLQEALPILGECILVVVALSHHFLARGRALSRMAQDWQVLLTRIETERNEV